MIVYSRKRRRRMHALPAALALIMFAILWLISNKTSAEVVLDAQSLEQWNRDCRRCLVEAQYDVIKGEIVRLEVNMGEASISRPFVSNGSRPVLAWSWSVDEYDVERKADLFRITVDLKNAENDKEYRVHYVWDPSAKRGDYAAISGDEFVFVVCGSDCKSHRWYDIERDLMADFLMLTGLEEVFKPIKFYAALGDPSGRKTEAGGYINAITISYLPESVSAEPIATND